MKLEEIAKRAIELIQENGEEGISTAELAKLLKVPKRRIYDVKAIMKAANLIKTKRDKTGTTLIWCSANGSSKISTIDSNKVKITNDGLITKVTQSGTEVIVEGTSAQMSVEALN